MPQSAVPTDLPNRGPLSPGSLETTMGLHGLDLLDNLLCTWAELDDNARRRIAEVAPQLHLCLVEAYAIQHVSSHRYGDRGL